MLVDTHMHTQFSTDSKMQLSEAREQARQLGIGITITEHLDLLYPEPDLFVFDVDRYFAEYQSQRNENLLLGIEIGMQPACRQENSAIVAAHPFDFVIGSIHLVGGMDIYAAHFYEGRAKQASYGDYFQAMLECVQLYDCFDSLGHIDYIARYAQYPDTETHYHEFREAIDAVLRVVVAKEKALEINTRRLGTPGVAAALLPIYRRFAALGGRLVTLGSDSHRPSEVGRDLQVALQLAEAAGLQPVYFKARQPYYMNP